MRSKYPDSLHAQVIADARLGKPTRMIARERNLPERTAHDWVKAARDQALAENRDELLTNGEYRLAMQAQALTDKALQELADSGTPLYKYLVPLNAVRGTAIDKVMRISETPPIRIQADKLLIIMDAPKPQLIDAQPDKDDL